MPPIRLFGPIGSSFGTSIAFLGDINEDNFQGERLVAERLIQSCNCDLLSDFAIGAPFTEQGGTVYVYLGGRYDDLASANTAPIQVGERPRLRFSMSS